MHHIWNHIVHTANASNFSILLVLPLRTFSCLSEIVFRAYVYFKVTNLSNVLISSRTIAILILSYLIAIFSGIIVIFQFNLSMFVPYTLSLLFRSFFVPANIVVSHDGITQIFINNLENLREDLTQLMISTTNVGRAS